MVHLRVGLVGMVETNLELIDLTLKGLLDAEGLTLGLLLGLKRSRHRLHGAGMVLPAHETVKFIIQKDQSTWCC